MLCLQKQLEALAEGFFDVVMRVENEELKQWCDKLNKEQFERLLNRQAGDEIRDLKRTIRLKEAEVTRWRNQVMMLKNRIYSI